MFLNPLARLVSSTMLFLVLIVLLEEYIIINIRGLIKCKREEKK